MNGRRAAPSWLASGSPWVWLTAGMVSVSLIMVFGLLGLIAARGLNHFWPVDLVRFQLAPAAEAGDALLGEIASRELVTAATARSAGLEVPDGAEFVTRFLVKTGNRDLSGADFRWIADLDVVEESRPPQAFVAERHEWGNFYGYLDGLSEDGESLRAEDPWALLRQRLERKDALEQQIEHIEEDVIGGVNYRLERIRLERRALDLRGITSGPRVEELAEREAALQSEFDKLGAELAELYSAIRRDALVARTEAGEAIELPLAAIVRITRPNQMTLADKLAHYAAKLWEFVSTEPREANTEGGVFPAIFGTVLMVIIMSIFVTPFGVVAAVYLREYARQGPLTRAIRIAVNNLAGVPSVVYGVFGLGFFVYFLGSSIDELFFAEALPAPTFGTPGLLWSSLTLAILTVPVVIVATEEGLSRIPRAIREGSMALGATKAETLWRTVLPMATPAMMTGLILAVARAAGEVAPLMMVGVVKLAPSLPVDDNFPFLHLDRKFMHLGFHIYDVGFQSPNVEAARPLVYATALLLVVIIVTLNLAAIRIRNRLREKYNASDA